MNRLIFMNLMIDQVWDDLKIMSRLFPIRIPSSEKIVRANEDFGLYVADPNDYVLTFPQRNKAYDQYLEQFFRVPNRVSVHHNPYDQIEWLQEVEHHTELANKTFDSLLCVGSSNLERTLAAKFNIPCLESSNEYQDSYNRKSFLFDWAHQNKIKFPDSLILKELTNDSLIKFGPHFILKSEFGSGGGGNFSDSILNSKMIALLNRLTGAEQHIRWVLQRRYDRMNDYSTFGTIESQKGDSHFKVSNPITYSVLYDDRGLSYCHEPIDPMEPGLELIKNVYYQLAEDLASKGYRGDFGFDSFKTIKSELFPIIDLNVRTTKTHLIHRAAKKLEMENYCALRIRWNSKEPCSFETWWEPISKVLSLNSIGESPNGAIMRPFLVGALTGLAPQDFTPGPKEVSVFCSVPPDSNFLLTEWCQRVMLATKGPKDE